MNTYTVYVDDASVECQMNPQHFAFLQNVNSNELYFMGTINVVNEGIKLYKHYLTFHNTVNQIVDGTNIIATTDMKDIVETIHLLTQNEFLAWLHFDFTEDESKIIHYINNPKIPEHDSIIEYYIHNQPRYKSIFDVCRDGHLNVLKWLIPQMTPYETNSCIKVCILIASKNGRLEICKLLQSKFPNFIVKPMLQAMFTNGYNCYECVQWLLTLEPIYGQIDIHAMDDEPIWYACNKNKPELLRILLSVLHNHGNCTLEFEQLYKQSKTPEVKELLQKYKAYFK